MSEQQDRTGDVGQRLETVRAEIQRVGEQRSRLTGELDSLNRQKEELQKECQEKFGVPVEQLPQVIERLRREAEDALAEAERILGLGGGGHDGGGTAGDTTDS